MTGIAARPTRPDEAWTIIVVTDHGLRDGGGHGGESDLARSAWIVAAEALAVFGLLPVAPAQTLGRSFGHPRRLTRNPASVSRSTSTRGQRAPS